MGGAALAVVIPVYNEGEEVLRCLREVADVLAAQPPESSHLVVVDDGSCDATPRLLDEFGAGADDIHVVHHRSNQGYGAALRTGAHKARDLGSEWVLFMDSDLTNPPADIVRFRVLLDGPVDYVKASRYLPTGRAVGVPWQRRAVSVVGNRVAAALSGMPISDLTNGFRAIRTAAFLDMPLTERGFPIILEELYLARRMGLRLAELPTVLTNRAGDQRSSSFGYRPAVLWAYGRYAFLMARDRVQFSRKM
jgi:glycosyltransferase involved in cell wall biosynthesis